MAGDVEMSDYMDENIVSGELYGENRSGFAANTRSTTRSSQTPSQHLSLPQSSAATMLPPYPSAEKAWEHLQKAGGLAQSRFAEPSLVAASASASSGSISTIKTYTTGSLPFGNANTNGNTSSSPRPHQPYVAHPQAQFGFVGWTAWQQARQPAGLEPSMFAPKAESQGNTPQQDRSQFKWSVFCHSASSASQDPHQANPAKYQSSTTADVLCTVPAVTWPVEVSRLEANSNVQQTTFADHYSQSTPHIHPQQRTMIYDQEQLDLARELQAEFGKAGKRTRKSRVPVPCGDKKRRANQGKKTHAGEANVPTWKQDYSNSSKWTEETQASATSMQDEYPQVLNGEVPFPEYPSSPMGPGANSGRKSSAFVKEGDIVGRTAKAIDVKESKGAAMLMKMGWSAGQGLGKNRQGMTEPVEQVVKLTTSGLGAIIEQGGRKKRSNWAKSRK